MAAHGDVVSGFCAPYVESAACGWPPCPLIHTPRSSACSRFEGGEICWQSRNRPAGRRIFAARQGRGEDAYRQMVRTDSGERAHGADVAFSTVLHHLV